MSNRPNYVRRMDEILSSLGDSRPPLLLHACCGPCASAVLELLCRYFQVTILYYNPNIWPAAEYRRRLAELERFLQQAQPLGASLVRDEYDPAQFYGAVQGLEQEPERGARCTLCYRLRMERAAQYAAQHGFEWFTTTLSLSPLKDPVRINQLGEELEARYGVRHLTSEFKKRDGYKRSLELSTQYGLYRQAYCGCEYSARARGFDEQSAPTAAQAAPASGAVQPAIKTKPAGTEAPPPPADPAPQR